jgi:secreted trypsin-like serine protease
MSSSVIRWSLLALVLAPSLALAASGSSDGGESIPETTIVGGNAAPSGKWPDAVALLANGDQACTGTLIAPDVVITAGHCTDSGDIDEVKIDATDAYGGGETIGVARQKSYPAWETTYDVGVIVLEREATTRPREVLPACASSAMDDDAQIDVVGFGIAEDRNNSRLNEVRVTVTDPACSRAAAGCIASIAPDGEFGAGGGGHDSCNGDSGGPAYIRTPYGTFLIGVVSRAYEDSTQDCGDGGIYVRADTVLDWVREESDRSIPDADCDASTNPDDDGSGSGVGGGTVIGGCATSGGAGQLAAIAAALLALVAVPRRRRV